MTQIVRSFESLSPDHQSSAGGKGGMLARLYQAGYPVPEGFVVLPSAFDGDELTVEGWAEVRVQLAQVRKLQKGTSSFAVRSSALSEDSARASFVGEFETVLDVHSDGMIREAIHTVRHSRRAERVRVYSEAKGIDPVHDLAVVVQRLVRADISGVLFTAEPVSGNQARMTGSFVHGLGEALVSGEAEGQAFKLERRPGLWLGCRYEGPSELTRFAGKLFRLGNRLEKELERPQDIEWAIADGKLYLLQSRPITTLIGHNPITGEHNDSLTDEYLWSNTNLGEAFIDVLTPFTYSVALLGAAELVSGHRLSGIIGGRFYFSLSMVVSMYGALGVKDQVLRMTESSLGRLPEDLDTPMIPFSVGYTLAHTITRAVKTEMRQAKHRKNLDGFLDATPQWCERMQQRIQQAGDGEELITLWQEELEPYFVDTLLITKAAGSLHVDIEPGLHRRLAKLVGETDTSILLANASGRSEILESIGPMAGLSKVTRGEMSRDEYLVRYGHRGPHEMELSIPRPAEDSHWLEWQLEEARKSSIARGYRGPRVGHPGRGRL